MLLLSTRIFLIASSYLIQSYSDKVRITAPNIANKCNVNSRALMPALRRLTQAGILKSQTGGREPGFMFARDPAKITISDIIIALEGETQMLSCREIIEDINCKIEKCENCKMYKIFKNRIETTDKDLKNTSLKDYNKNAIKN